MIDAAIQRAMIRKADDLRASVPNRRGELTESASRLTVLAQPRRSPFLVYPHHP